MGRYAVDYTDPSGNFYGTDDTPIETHLQDFRDRMRVALSSSTMVVSDICKWTGSSNQRGYAFVVKNGAREWLFIKGQSDSTGLDFADFVCNNNSSFLEDFFRTYDTYTTISTSNDYHLAIHYNCGVGSYNMGFDDGVNLTYAGGDFSSPAFSPYSQIYDFMPVSALNVDQMLRGYVYTGIYSSGFSEYSRHLFIFDDTEDVLAWYATNESDPELYVVALMGNALSNYNAGDLNQEVVLSIRLTNSTTSPGFHASENVHAFDASGNIASFNIEAHENFTRSNRKDVNGDFYWNSVQVRNPSYTKGLLNSDLVRVAGVYSSIIDRFKVLDGPGGPLYICTEKLAFPYAENLERFPYPGNVF